MKNERDRPPAGSARSPNSSIPSRSTAVPIAANARSLSACTSFSAPTATATSTSPEATASHARWNALEPDAQAFSTFITGSPKRPVCRSAASPRIISCPVINPAAALPNITIPGSVAAMPASASASRTASSASERIPRSGNFPNGVIPTPAITTSLICPPLSSSNALRTSPCAAREKRWCLRRDRR